MWGGRESKPQPPSGSAEIAGLDIAILDNDGLDIVEVDIVA